MIDMTLKFHFTNILITCTALIPNWMGFKYFYTLGNYAAEMAMLIFFP